MNKLYVSWCCNIFLKIVYFKLHHLTVICRINKSDEFGFPFATFGPFCNLLIKLATTSFGSSLDEGSSFSNSKILDDWSNVAAWKFIVTVITCEWFSWVYFIDSRLSDQALFLKIHPQDRFSIQPISENPRIPVIPYTFRSICYCRLHFVERLLCFIRRWYKERRCWTVWRCRNSPFRRVFVVLWIH